MAVMTPRLMLLSIVPVFAAATAHAQAPGEWTPEPGYAQPPPVVAPPPAAPSQRWSVGVSVGQTELAANGYEDQSVTFGGGSIALRYRGWRHLELELSFGGGREQLPDGGGEGDLAMATGTLAARYRFNPERKWNWWLLAGVGGTTVARHDATDEEISAAQRPHATFGVGVERRWNRFALQFELRALAVGQTEQEKMYADTYGTTMETGLSGGNFALGASYYF
jgi:hypothetical protein